MQDWNIFHKFIYYNINGYCSYKWPTPHRSKVNGYQFNNWDSIPGRFGNNSLHHHFPDELRVHHASYQMGTSTPFFCCLAVTYLQPVSTHKAILPCILHLLLAKHFGTKTIRPDFYSLKEPHCFTIFTLNFVLGYASIFVFIVKNLFQHTSSLLPGDVSTFSNP